MANERVVRTGPKTTGQLAAEWDALAGRRHAQIAAHADLSFDHVLVPLAKELLAPANLASMLDVGCGTGELTLRATDGAERVVGVDLSSVSLEFARETLGETPHVSLVQGAIEDLGESLAGPFTTALVGMTLMTVPDLRAFGQSLSKLISPGGHVVVTMTHPWFWPRYWGYESAQWFNYHEETFIEAPFSISLESTEFITTHIHRPLEQILAEFGNSGFVLEALREPMPEGDVLERYPEPWAYPRFIGLRWSKAV